LQQEQQQQLIILKQQLQQQQNTAIPALPSQATPYPVLPTLQPQVSDRDRQIALLEKELRIQKMMLEVERREAMLREQATLLSAQEERMKQEQLQSALRYRAPAGGSEVLAKYGASEQDNGVEKARPERMCEAMEMTRKEELMKIEANLKNARIENKNSPIEEINMGAGAGKRKSGKLQKSEVSCMKDKSASKVMDVEDDVLPSKPGFPFDDSDMLEVDDAEEQRKILEAIKRRNEEKKNEEELTMRLITKLSFDETEELTPQNLDDGWPDLGEATPGAGETVREKIERLKRMAERRGMCVNGSSSRENKEPPVRDQTYSKGKL